MDALTPPPSHPRPVPAPAAQETAGRRAAAHRAAGRRAAGRRGHLRLVTTGAVRGGAGAASPGTDGRRAVMPELTRRPSAPRRPNRTCGAARTASHRTAAPPVVRSAGSVPIPAGSGARRRRRGPRPGPVPLGPGPPGPHAPGRARPAPSSGGGPDAGTGDAGPHPRDGAGCGAPCGSGAPGGRGRAAPSGRGRARGAGPGPARPRRHRADRLSGATIEGLPHSRPPRAGQKRLLRPLTLCYAPFPRTVKGEEA